MYATTVPTSAVSLEGQLAQLREVELTRTDRLVYDRDDAPLLEVRTDAARTARCWLETNPGRRAEVRARGAFGVDIEGAPAPAEEYHRAAAAQGAAPPVETGPPRQTPAEQQLPRAEKDDVITQRDGRGVDDPEGGPR